MALDAVVHVRSIVQQWLAEEFVGVMIGKPGVCDYELAIGSTFLRVTVSEFIEESVVISVVAPMLWDVPITDEFKQYVLETSGQFVFGGFHYFEDDGGANLVFQHSILGQYVDKEELINSVYVVGSTADGVGADLQVQFGGRRPLEE